MNETPESETAAVLDITDATKYFAAGGGGEKVRAIDGVSLTATGGDFVALHGASGCGKSTLLLMAGGLLSPDSGEVSIAGENPYSLNPDARAAFRAGHVGFVFQQFHLIPFLDVLDNVLICELAGINGSEGDNDLRERARALLEKFNLGHRMDHVPSKLSIGEQQRVALARALLREPKLILADEPTGNLDTENSEIILKHLSEFAASGEGAVLMVTHDDRAKAAASRALEMADGKIVN
jgi:putative ABC transport system ATP-binding protein